MEIESRTAVSQKIGGKGRSDSTALLSGFYSKQTHNGLQNVVEIDQDRYVQRPVTLGSVNKSVIIKTCAHVRVLLTVKFTKQRGKCLHMHVS